jgi:hypothetical protein
MPDLRNVRKALVLWQYMKIWKQSGIVILSYDYKLRPVTPVLRLFAQQSNCFVVERGKAMSNMPQERALAQSGELR